MDSDQQLQKFYRPDEQNQGKAGLICGVTKFSEQSSNSSIEDFRQDTVSNQKYEHNRPLHRILAKVSERYHDVEESNKPAERGQKFHHPL